MSDNNGRAEASRPPKTFLEFVHLRRTQRDRTLNLNDKLRVYELIHKLGYETPKIYEIFDSPTEIDISKFPSQLVLKPHNLAAKRGVFLLHRISGGHGYWESLSRRRLWQSTIQRKMSKWSNLAAQQGRSPVRFVAEELVIGNQKKNHTPLDYKVYTFNGRIPLILQIDRNTSPVSIAFLDANFEAIDVAGRVKLGRSMQLGRPVAPKFGEQIIHVARDLSQKLKTPFISVDMYDSNRGALIGELTGARGGPYFAKLFCFERDFDLYLGSLWRDAAKELAIPLGEFFVHGSNSSVDKETPPIRPITLKDVV